MAEEIESLSTETAEADSLVIASRRILAIAYALHVERSWAAGLVPICPAHDSRACLGLDVWRASCSVLASCAASWREGLRS